MKRTGAALFAIAAIGLVGGCASGRPSPLPGGPQAYDVIPEHAQAASVAETIQIGDRLALRVFGEPELTGESYVVDSAGYIQVPLIGEMIAAGQTTRQLGGELQRRLSARFVRDASVTVAVLERPQSTYTVEGEVTTPGVYPAFANSTLLSAIAQAKSPTRTAKTSDVLVFRQINGARAGARFNLNDIRRGRAADPEILPGDTIVLVGSATKSAWRDFLTALPVLNLFVLFKN